MDVIDSHAYWQHPDFHGKGWNADDWSVKNIPMAGREDGGTLPGLALQRVAGKPYICTEYSHPAPNEYGAETFPLLCAYAALQDWDGIFAFAYSHRTDDWDKRYFPSFFDIDQHPVKMATLPASVAMFLRGDVSRAAEEQVVKVSLRNAVEKSRGVGPRIGADNFLPNTPPAIDRRVCVQLSETDDDSFVLRSNLKTKMGTPEFQWDIGGRFFSISAARSKALIGAIPAIRTTELDDVTISSASTLPDFATIQLTVTDGDNFADAKRLLITATGRAANTDMKWTSDAHESVGRNWGRAPSLVEGIAAKITLPVSGQKMKAWALDERGQRRDEIPLTNGTLEIGPQYRTLWYEVATE